MEPSFEVTKQDAAIIHKIAVRANNVAKDIGFKYPVQDAAMDITAVHANGNPLRLQRLLDADKFNFAHDIAGIRNCLDRDTGKLNNCFEPRCTDYSKETQCQA